MKNFENQPVDNNTVPLGGSHLVDVADGCTEDACPNAPTGYAAPGSAHGQITATWEPATTGGAAAQWHLKATSLDFEESLHVGASARSHTFSNLATWRPYRIVVQGVGTGSKYGDAALTGDVFPTDTVTPTFSSAEVIGNSLTLTFSEPLNPDSAPEVSAFSVSATPTGGTARNIAGAGAVVFSGVTATVTLAEVVRMGETVTVSYAKPATGSLQDHGGNEVANFTDQSVTNYSALVSNFGLADAGDVSLQEDFHMPFNIGDNASGYKLTHLDLEFLSSGYGADLHRERLVGAKRGLQLPGQRGRQAGPAPDDDGLIADRVRRPGQVHGGRRRHRA